MHVGTKYKFKWEQKDKKSWSHNPEVESFYTTPAWARMAATHKQLFPLCKHCERKGLYVGKGMIGPKGKIVKRMFTDHTTPLTPDTISTMGLDWDNLQTLCPTCHAIKTARQNGKYSAANLQKGKQLQNQFNDFDND